MHLWQVIISLAVISVVWALWSLRGVLKNHTELDAAKKELLKGRVVYQKESSSSSS